jgi:hypothetical protein
MLLSLDRLRVSSYINCLKEHFNDHKLVDSMAFLIASAKGDNLEFFSPTDDGVEYFERLEDIKGECDGYVNLFSAYDPAIIKNASVKLWYYYANKPVEFIDEERQLLYKLGINL